LIKNCQPFGGKVRKPQGDFFDSYCSYTIGSFALPIVTTPSS